ncbi:alpha/beta-hydrolase [Pluteus cervinus]|uniref:Alpha/beta-hydrolase n=1 Tax=Pluteus cervinus TaxID=181527 RepID=A0ACD3BAK3_9AGAR|nr:alpha/beta-hydrolase [Pluteus cervinus]
MFEAEDTPQVPYTETLLSLPEGRTLAYDTAGDSNSLTLVLFFHGVFGVGNASYLSKTLQAKGVHYVTPTLPGWGSSSARPSGVSFVDSLTADITALIHHLYPNTSSHNQLDIYIGGGSYGSVSAQIIYGQPFDKFPLGFNKGLSWMNYIMVGTPAQVIPGQLVPYLVSTAMKPRFATPEKAIQAIREISFDKMDEEEKEVLAKYEKEKGTEGGFEAKTGLNAWRSVHKGWAGFTEVSDVIWSDWGFIPKEIDAEGLERHVLVVASQGDGLAPNEQAVWISQNYGNAELMMVEGGHLSAVYYLDDIWAKFIDT